MVYTILRKGILSGFRGYPEGHLGGEWVQKLEQAFIDYFGVKYAISMNSATACLHAALLSVGIGEGDEVIVTPYSFSASASCVLMVGATPVFADIDPDTYCITMDTIMPAVNEKTKAFIPVHLCGNATEVFSPMDDWGRAKFHVIHDTAQAITTTRYNRYVASLGDCGIISFNQSKHINTGEGGMLLTNNDDLARKARAVRNHGEVSDPELRMVGYNYRLCEIEAYLALEQFKKIDAQVDRRIELANYLTYRLKDIEGLDPPRRFPWAKHVYYTYPIKLDPEIWDKEKVLENPVLREYNMGAYVKPLHLLPIYEKFGYKEGDMPVAERMWRKELIVFDQTKPPRTEKDMDRIVEAFKSMK
jgi:perosamine synthetase